MLIADKKPNIKSIPDLSHLHQHGPEYHRWVEEKEGETRRGETALPSEPNAMQG